MPNWVESVIQIKSRTKDSIDKFLDSAIPETGADGFDYSFASWIPMPQTYKDFDTTNIHYRNLKVGDEIYAQGNNKVTVTKELIEEYRKAEEYQASTYGSVGWYSWSCNNWGTKWNAGLDICQGIRYDLNILTSTAWSPPIDFFLEISRRFPDFVISIKSHDEGGENWWFIVENGKVSNDLSLVCDSIVGSILLRNIPSGLSKEESEVYKENVKKFKWYDITTIDDEEEVIDQFREFVRYVNAEEDECTN